MQQQQNDIEEEKLFKYVIEDDDFIKSITNQFKQKQQLKEDFDFSKVDYNNYYINNGVQHIKQRLKTNLDDPYINLIINDAAKSFVTPLEEWNNRKLKNNNIQNKKDISYITYLI
jgi:hypothetical protein